MRHYLSYASGGNSPDAVKKAYQWIEEQLEPANGIIIPHYPSGGNYSTVIRKCLDKSSLIDHTQEAIIFPEFREGGYWPHYPSGLGYLRVFHPYIRAIEADWSIDKIIQSCAKTLADENISVLAITGDNSWYYPNKSITILCGDTELFDWLDNTWTILDFDYPHITYWRHEAGPNSSYSQRRQTISDLHGLDNWGANKSSMDEDIWEEQQDAATRLVTLIRRTPRAYDAWSGAAKDGDYRWAITSLLDAFTVGKVYEGFDPSDLVDKADIIHRLLLEKAEKDGWDISEDEIAYWHKAGIYNPGFLFHS